MQAGPKKGTTAKIAAMLAILTALAGTPVAAQSVEELQQLSIDELANIQVTSVSKAAQPLSDAPASVYVITRDEIERSGATSLPEILRLAPNLQVAQMSADSWAISARGFNGNAADKLLVLIDGRSVYTPLYGGVLWDEKDVLPENIERIEVISGPGATLWGANAVNGVINIITRKAKNTQGGVLDLIAGNREDRASLDYGGAPTDDLAYRLYLEAFRVASDKTSVGTTAEDGWWNSRGGFRLDWTPQDDALTLQGDYYQGAEDAAVALHENISGGTFQTSWEHHLDDGSTLDVLAYYDGTRRFADRDGYALNTYDFEFQHTIGLDGNQELVWGAGYRAYQDRFALTGAVQFLPPSMVQSVSDIFAQDNVTLTDALNLSLGLKIEDDPFSGLAALPTARLSWKASPTTMFWTAVSRAVRAPTRFDTDLQDTIIPSILILTGNRDFQPEKLTAYELGTRVQPSDYLSFSVSTYYNVYSDLRSVEWAQRVTLPLIWTYGNMMEGDTFGLEAWGEYQVLDNWKLAAGFNVQHEDLRFKPGSSALGGTATAGDDPNHQASIRSSVNFTPEVAWEADFRYVGILHDPVIPAYVELNSRLVWNISKSLEVAVDGLNLLHARHLEYEEDGATVGDEVEREVYVETKWRF